MPLYQNGTNFPVVLHVGPNRRSITLQPTQSVNLDSTEVEAAQNSIREGLLVPVPAEPLHHNDSEANLRFVEKVVEILEGPDSGGLVEDNLRSIDERNHWLSQVTKPRDALSLVGDIDAILALLERDSPARGPNFTNQVQELGERWVARREALRNVLVPTAWERIVQDDPDEG